MALDDVALRCQACFCGARLCYALCRPGPGHIDQGIFISEWGMVISTLEQKKNTILALISRGISNANPLTDTSKWHNMGVSGGKWEIRYLPNNHGKTPCSSENSIMFSMTRAG
jgi:hypothetical protein